jgi:rhamnulokinase
MGATSIRVAAVDLAAPEPNVEILHRWQNAPVEDTDGHLRWNWPRIVEQVQLGLEKGLDAGPVSSIGVDGWGVDYGLLDDAGNLIDLPYAYRDRRTEGWEATAERIGIKRLYATTGIQLMGLNTIFQLAADPPDRLDPARTILLLPDLLVNHLTGWVGCEHSNMSTTGLMDVRTGQWSEDLIDTIHVPRDLFPEPAAAGQIIGSWRDIPISLIGSHDTASAFVGVPSHPDTNSVFVSTGSWVIVGVDRTAPDTSERARKLNFSNEAGALGGVRFLKNVVGFWILEQCRSAWGDPEIEDLIGEAESVDEEVPVFDASDHRFVSTTDMMGEIARAAALPTDTPRAVIVRSIIESIVAGVVKVIDEIAEVTGQMAQRALLVGGGSRIPLLREVLRRHSGLEVAVGSAEATALGNAMVQGIATGVFADMNQARSWLSSDSQNV